MSEEAKRAVELQIELFGIPRRRVGRSTLRLCLEGDSCRLGELIDLLLEKFPALRADVDGESNLLQHVMVCLNDDRFVRDRDHIIKPNDRMMLLSADIGG